MAKRKPKPRNSSAGKKRDGKQAVKERYQKAREDAQLVGLLDTVPEGALHEERVNPATQTVPGFPSLERRAFREEWDVPHEYPPQVIDGQYRIAVSEEARPKDRTEAAKFLLAASTAAYRARTGADQQQPNQVNLGVQINGGPDASQPTPPPFHGYDQRETVRRLNELARAVGVEEAGTVRGGREVADGPGDDEGLDLVEPLLSDDDAGPLADRRPETLGHAG